MNQKIGAGLALALIIGGVTYLATASDLDPNGPCARAPVDSQAPGDCIQLLPEGGFRALGPGVAAPYQMMAGARCERVRCPDYITDAGAP